MKTKIEFRVLFAVLLINALISGLVISCGNPWIRDLTDPLVKEKEKEKNKPQPGPDPVTPNPGDPEYPTIKPITAVNITVTGPANGEMPDTTAEGDGNYTIGAVSWSPDHSSFMGDTQYTAFVTLTANNGYTFTGLSEAAVNGNSATITNNTGIMITISYSFAPTLSRTITGLTVTSQPAKMTYTHGDKLDLFGLAVTLVFDDNTSETVSLSGFELKTISANPSNGETLSRSTHNGNPVIVSLGKHSANTETLTVNKANPAVSDFNISNLTQTAGNVTAVSITHKDGKTTGDVAIKYNNSTTLPTAAGDYTVTFDVAADDNWNSASGLEAGMLKIYNADVILNTADELGSWLTGKPANSTSNPYTVVLNGITDDNIASVKTMLSSAANKYVILDLSGSSFTSIPVSYFYGSPFLGGCTTLVGIIIPDTVTSIGESAFQSCFNLTSVTIPDSVTSIGNNCFYSCISLTSVIIPDNVTSIGDYAFNYCKSLTSVTIGNSVTSIGEYAFIACTALTDVIIGNSVTSIGWSAFSECSGLVSLTIPASVKSIGGYAFISCTGLTSVTFETGSDIADAEFGNYAFPEGDITCSEALKNTYIAANPKEGTYIWTSGSNTWTRQ